MTAPILVAGATGYLGRFIVAELHRRGHRVRAVVRDRDRAVSPGPWEAPGLEGLVDEWIVGDVTDPGVTPGIAAGADAVISALGVTRQRADPWDIDYRANLAILRSAESHGARCFCFVNVIGGEQCPARLTRAKTAFTRELASSSIPSQTINPPGYFSDMIQILRMARRGRVLVLRRGVRINPIHDDHDRPVRRPDSPHPGRRARQPEAGGRAALRRVEHAPRLRGRTHWNAQAPRVLQAPRRGHGLIRRA